MITDRYHKNKIVNLMRIVYIPMVIAIVIIIGISLLMLRINSRNLISQYKEEGVLLASQISSQLSSNIKSQEYVESILEDKIRVAASAVLELEQMNSISNDMLNNLLDILNVSELHYMNEKGEILFSTIEGYLGWIPHKDHPLYDFVRSPDMELMEAVRPDDKYKRLIKYGSIKSKDGSFVQVGIDAEILQHAKNQFSYQSVIDQISDNKNLIGIRFLDLDLNNIAYSSEVDLNKAINLDLDFFNSQEDVLIERLYASNNQIDGYEFYIPVFYENHMFGILNIDYSLEQFTDYNRLVIWINIALIVCLAIILSVFQYFNIIVPIHELEKNIKQVDVGKNMFYKLPIEGEKSFYGIVNIINKILENTYGFIAELNKTKEDLENSNEELSAAYQQIKASEEVLGDQYDEIIKQKKYIEYIAFHDDLTGLSNRQGFVQWLNEKLETEKRGAIILVGIDNFKGINNTLGHQFGDNVLRNIAEILKESASNVYVSRFSGDEFILYFSNFEDVSEIDGFITSTRDKLKNSVEVNGRKVYITTSIGISIYPNDSTEIYKLIMNADSAVYKVKEKGKNGYLYFDEDMIKSITKKSKIEDVLRKAVEENLFKLVYQPQVSILTGKVVGLEALLRIRDNACSPEVFIPVAEELGIIIPIGRWVAKTVVKQVALWRDQGFDTKVIAFNFSPVQQRDRGFSKYLNDLLLQYDVPSKNIEIEITENILIDNMDEALVYLNKFKALNINLALDDFGTGFSSINYLSTLPINKVKLDKSVIWKYTNKDKDDVIKTLIELSKCFDLSLVAEGVEDENMISKLRGCGGDLVQGYFFSKPVEVDKVYEVINEIENKIMN